MPIQWVGTGKGAAPSRPRSLIPRTPFSSHHAHFKEFEFPMAGLCGQYSNFLQPDLVARLRQLLG